MECLELRIPPLPQLVTVGHAIWTEGMQHFRRSFQVFDLIFVRSGCFYMTENDQAYELHQGGLLLLEPGMTHWGHRPVDTNTEIYWLHFVHPLDYNRVESEQIAWSSWLKTGSDQDLAPTEQWMYVPKYGYFEPSLVTPLLDKLVELHTSLTLRDVTTMHALTAQLFARLQSLIDVKLSTKAYQHSEQVISYLQEHMLQPFNSAHMEERLHYHSDYLSRCLKQYTGMSPLQFMHRLRMERAKVLLRQTDLTVQEIAEQVGLHNGNYFIRIFRKHYGMPPGKYRKQTRELL